MIRVNIITSTDRQMRKIHILFMLKIIRSKTLIHTYFETDFNKHIVKPLNLPVSFCKLMPFLVL